MAMVLLVAATDAGEPNVGPGCADQLRQLGISRISLLSDGSVTGVVLEGWAFDPDLAAEASRAIFPGMDPAVRTFHEIEQVAVTASRGSRRFG